MLLGQELDFLGNIAKSIKFEPLAVDPPLSAYPGSTSGAIYYNTTSGVNRIHNGSEWINIVKINGTVGRTSVTYSSNPMVAVVDIDQTVLDNYLPLSGGNITGPISATAFYDTSFIGNKVLISDPTKEIIESSVTNTELSYLTNVSANIQTQLNQLSQATVSGNGAGTPNRLTKFVTSSSMGDSSITDTGSLVTFTTPISSNNTITAPNFTGLASRATSALQADILKTSRTFSLSGEVTSNVVSFNGSNNVVLSATIGTGIDATKIANGSVTNTEFQYINSLSANAQTQLTNLSASKANSSVTITTTSGLTGGGDLSTNRTFGLVAVGTSGTYSNFVTNAYGQITSARALISADIPTIPPSKILEDANDRFVSDAQINSWTGTTTTVQSNSANWNLAYTSAHNHTNKPTLDLINQSLNTSANVLFNSISATTITVGSIDNTEFSYLNTVSANIQTQLNSKIDSSDAIQYLTNSADVSATTFKPAFYNQNGNANNQFLLFRRSTAGSNIDYIHLNDTDNSYGFYTDTILENPVPNAIICAGDYYDSSFSNSNFALISNGKRIAESSITDTELNFLDNVSANIQTQINNIKSVTDNAVVKNPGSIQIISGAALAIARSGINDALYARVDGDTFSRFLIQTNGKMFWGDGTSARDTFLYRSGVGQLKTDGDFIVGGNISATSITVGNIDNTEFNYLNGTSANIQTQLTNLSATKANSSITITAGTMLSGGGDLSTNRTISHQTVGTSGTYSNIVTNSTGHITSARALISADIPTLPATKIGTGIISDIEFNYLDGVSANIQTQINNIQYGVTGRFTSAINIVYGGNSITINHNLGYLRPNVMLIDETDDQLIIVSPIYISTSQLVLPITSNRAITGARLEVSV